MRWYAALLVPLLIPLTSPAAAERGAIMGAVVDADGTPLTGATVYLIIQRGGCPSVIETTDADGRFAFTQVQPGLYNVRAEKAGYLTQMFREQATGPHSFGRSIVLTPSHLQDDIKVVLPRASATVSGVVYGEDGRPLPAGGWVFFEDESHHDMGTTGLPKGRYSVSNLPFGRYYISAVRYSPEANQAVGERWYYPDTTDKDQATLVMLSEVPANVDIHFGQPRPAAAIFRVLTDRDLPLARAEITLVRRRGKDSRTRRPVGGSPWQAMETLRTDAAGVAEARGLPSGNYYAFVNKVPPPFASWRNAAVPSTSLDYYATSFHLDDDTGPAQIDFLVSPGLELTGRFVMRDGSVPPSGHGVTIDLCESPRVGGFRGDMSFLAESRRIDEAHFVVSGLLPKERYTLREFDADHLKPIVIVGIRMNGQELVGDDIVLSSFGEVNQTLDVILDRAGVVSGTIARKMSGRAVARRVTGDVPAALYPSPASAEVVGGRFVFRGLPPGDYDISLEGRPGVHRVEVRAGRTLEVSF
jgi:hypothetical protein